MPMRRDVWIVDWILFVSFLRIRFPMAALLIITSKQAAIPTLGGA